MNGLQRKTFNTEKKEIIANEFKNIREIISAADIDRFFIYGAGRVGLLVYFLLKQNFIMPHAFVVSHKNTDRINGIPIPILEYTPEMFDESDILFVAALGDAKEEIKAVCGGDPCKKIDISEIFYAKYYEIFCDRIEKILSREKALLYRSAEDERITIENYFKDVKDVEFRNKYRRLIKNLDSSSREAIIKCIQRVRKVNECDDIEMDIFSEEEKKEMLKVYYCFKDQVVQLDEEIWSYRGYLLPVNDFSSAIFYDRLGLPVIKNLDFCRDRDVIDVGGYIGDSALVLSEVTHGKVHIFEPIESNVKMIEKTGRMNQLNISIVNMAASDQGGTTVFSFDHDNSTDSSYELEKRNYEKKIEVKTISIDQYAEENNLDIGLIKIHAEGSEQAVLKGAVNVIKKQAPIIIVEISHTESDFFNIKPMLEKINPDYKLKIYKPANGLVCLGMKLIAEIEPK